MKKKILLTLAAAMAVTSVSFASPLSNYEKGSLAIDLNTSISPKVEIDVGDLSASDDAKNRLGAGITYGIGNKLALQYKFSDNKTKDYFYEETGPGYYENGRENAQIAAHELNVLYQINPNVSAFVGLTRTNAKVNWSYNYGPNSGNIIDSESGKEKQSQNGYQVGFIAQTKLAENVTGWASASAGNKVTSYEIGVGYDVAKNTELNLFYRNNKYKDFDVDGTNFDVTTKGLGAGVTVKF
jgi:hypothetical protein